jgi:ribose transport system permease protein
MRTFLLSQAPLLILIALCGTFTAMSPRFLTWQNVANVLQQSSSGAILAAGMVFVLLTGGIDLSVGSAMFLGACILGVLVAAGYSTAFAVVAALVAGPVCGLVHGLLITRGQMSPFIVTMSSLFILRGSGLWLTRTQAINLPESFTQLASISPLGLPLPVWLAAATIATGHYVLNRTTFGRQLLAIGHDPAAARKAGVNVSRSLTAVYVISGTCAALGGLTALAQLGAVSPTFGREREFDAIAAAVLGGTSLFGGRGNVFPGAVVGTMIVVVVFNGLNILNANPYIYPLITGSVILLAVLLDSLRGRQRSGGRA